MSEVLLTCRDKLLVFCVPDVLIREAGDVGNELPQSPIGIEFGELSENLEENPAFGAYHGRTSFTFCIPVTSTRGEFWTTSAAINPPVATSRHGSRVSRRQVSLDVHPCHESEISAA